jgi:hypothetical protein
MHAGWSWIGYAPWASMAITEALQHYRRVLSLNQTYDVCLPRFGTLKTLEPSNTCDVHS